MVNQVTLQGLKTRTVKPGIIQCLCGVCSLTVADDQAACFFMCGCSDCRQFAQYAHVHGGAKPVTLPSLFYFKSDIVAVAGREHLVAIKLRANGNSTRLCCRKCYSILAVEHPGCWGNVFVTFPDYCDHQCDLSRPLSAYTYMAEYKDDDEEDYDSEDGSDWEPYVPLFESFRYLRQRMQFNLLPDRIAWKDNFVSKGIRLSELIKELNNTVILDLIEEKHSSLELKEQNAALGREVRSLTDQIILWREMAETSDFKKRRVQVEMINLGDQLKRYEQEFGSLYYNKPT